MATKVLKGKAVDQDVLTLARQRIERCFDQFDTVMVSFSGGKDSTVVLNLALEEARKRDRLPLLVMSFDEEAIPYETEQYMRRVAQMPEVDFKWLCLPIAHRNGCSKSEPLWYPWAEEDRDKWVRPLPPEAITEWGSWPLNPPEARITIPDGAHLLFNPREQGRIIMLMGIRADESITRRRAVSRRTEDNYIIPHYPTSSRPAWLWKAYPIYDWTTPDVWRAPTQFGWDTNEAYDVMEMAGVNWHDQRCAPPFGEQPMRGLYTFKTCFPDIWDKTSRRVPGAATAARYANSTLYGAGHGGFTGDDLVEGQSWQDKVAKIINEHPEGARQDVAKRVRQWIATHFRHTSDPILFAAHPVTGVGWRFLLKVAEKGDFKDRLQPAVGMTDENRARLRKKYEKELEAYNAQKEANEDD
jgi:predicted phosphoadenosine phosphosulfate sulfurtransferase